MFCKFHRFVFTSLEDLTTLIVSCLAYSPTGEKQCSGISIMFGLSIALLVFNEFRKELQSAICAAVA